MIVIRNEAVKNLKPALYTNIKLHQEITKNFSEKNKPKWFLEITVSSKTKFKVGYVAEKARGMRQNKSVYWLLNNGTKVRRAALSPNWISKTTPGRVGSGAGQGTVLDVGKKYNFKGIEARNWDEAINKILLPQYDLKIIKGFRKGFGGS